MPNPEQNAHKFLFDTLADMQIIRAIKLVARLHDGRIGNSDATKLHIFIGDMHMISRAKIGSRYKAGFNHERMFVEFIKRIRYLKRSQTVYPIRVYQLGDGVDLWKMNTADPDVIWNTYQGVRDYFFNSGHSTGIGCQFVLGNHDGEIAQNPTVSNRWAFRRFIDDNGEAVVYLTHGDVFDWIEKLPPALKQWAVYHFSPAEPKPRQGLGDIIDLKKDSRFEADITRVSQIGELPPVQMDTLDPSVNVRKGHRFLQACFDRVSERNHEENLRINAAVIGHTHDAQIAVLEEGSKFFALLDCGAWCGTYEATPKPLPNCQIGVICGNDFRIYQLEPNLALSPQFEKDPVK